MFSLRPGLQIDELVKHNYKMLKSRKDDEVILRLKKQLDTFSEYMPLLQEVSNPALELRHWANIFGLLQQPYEEGQAFCVKDLIS